MEDSEWIENTKDVIGKLNCYLNQKTMEKLLKLYVTEEDPEQKEKIREEIESILGIYSPQLYFSKKPMLESPQLEKCSGEIALGTIMQGDRNLHSFSVSLSEIQKHVAIFGTTGFGKTTLIINILNQLLQQKIPFLYFDFKQDLRHIKEWPIIVLRWNWLKINPLQPPKGVDEKQWMTTVAGICSHTFGWFWASENYLMQFMHKLYEEKKGKSYPTIREVYELIASKKETSRRLSEYRDVVMNRLASMLIVLEGVIDCEKGFAFEELLDKPVVIELDGLRRDEQNFLVELLLAYVFCYRIANKQRGELRHVLVFDEATRIYFRKREYSETTIELGMPFVDTVPQIIRDYCEGMIFAAQEPSIISHSVLANTNLKIVGFLGDGEDKEAVEKSLDLEEDERSAIGKLECGEWLVKKQGIKPFLMRSQDFPFEKNVSDEELEKKMQPALSSLMKSVELSVESEPKPERPERKVTKEIPLSEDAKLLISHINSHPFMTISSRYKQLGISGRRLESAKEEIISKRLVKEVSIALSVHRPAKFLVLTDIGLSYLKNAGQDVSLWQKVGNVGFEHMLYQVLIAYSLKNSGWQAFIEKDVGSGRRVDVLAVKDGKRIGIEVELGSVNLEEEISCLDQLDELAILVADYQTTLRTASEIQRLGKQKVWVCQISKFLAKLRSNINSEKNGINSFSKIKPDSCPNGRNKSGINRRNENERG